MHETMLTSARKRALIAVRQGMVTRRYHKSGNVIEPGLSGISARTFWHLINLKLIEDGPTTGELSQFIWCQMKLTKEGERLLNEGTA